VAQIARSIAEKFLREASSDNAKRGLILALGGIDADVAEAAGLAHDLGHPPFGHIAESILDEIALAKEPTKRSAVALGLYEGFEGNPQSYRIAVRLEPYKERHAGLSLTAATQAAIMKYPWPRSFTANSRVHRRNIESNAEYRFRWKKFGHFRHEAIQAEDCREWIPAGILERDGQSLEASIMDVADDITFAIHDLEDFYAARILDLSAVLGAMDAYLDNLVTASLTELADSLRTDFPSVFKDETFREVVQETRDFMPLWLVPSYEAAYDDTRKLRQFVSRMIGTMVQAVTISETPRFDVNAHVHLPDREWHVIQLMMEFVVARSDVGLMQRSQQTLVIDLVQLLRDWSEADDRRLPPRLRDELEVSGPDEPHGPVERALLDYVCTLTDAQAVNMYKALSGVEVPEVFTGQAW